MDLLDQMQTFVRVVQGGSLTAAARASDRSLAAVSRQISALEAELGAPLLLRTTRRLRLTEAGERWYAHCVAVLDQVQRARDDVLAAGTLRGRLGISASVTLGTELVVPRLPALAAAHPDLRIDLRLEDRLVDLLGDAVDVAIRGGVAPPDSPGLVARRWLTFERVVVGAPHLPAPDRPEALAALPCVVQVGEAGRMDRWPLLAGDDRVEVDVGGPIRCSAPVGVRQLARDGVGFALLPEWLVRDDLAAGRLVRVLGAWASPPVSVWVLHRIELRDAPRVRALWAALTAPYSSPTSPSSSATP